MTSLTIAAGNLEIVIEGETLQKFRKFWREHDFNLGIELLDAQHMWLVALLFHLDSLLHGDNNVEMKAVQAIFDEVIAYADTHFQAEELLLSELRFPQYENHSAGHFAFKESITNILRAPGNGDVDHARKLSRFLHDWLIHHIKKEDMAYRDFLKGSSTDANIFFQRLVADGSDFALSDNQLSLYAAVREDNEIIPGISNEVLAEIRRMWRSFSIRLDVPLIDMQHLWLIKMVVELEIALREKYDTRLNQLSDLLPDVKRYINEHFMAEETMMNALGYPQASSHKKLHDLFVRTVAGHNADYATRTRQGAAIMVHDLKDWLLSHIVIEDAKFAKLCREKNAEAIAISKRLIAEKKVHFTKAHISLYQYVIAVRKKV